MGGPGIARDGRVAAPVTLADVAPTTLGLMDPTVQLKPNPTEKDLGDVDGVDLSPIFRGAAVPSRELYAESFAPLVEFGWAPLRALRADTWKLIAAPRSELYDIERDPGEQTNRVADQSSAAQRL